MRRANTRDFRVNVSFHCFLFSFQSFQDNGRVASPTGRTAQNKIPINGGGDRFFEEFDYERRLKKRKAKLISATEEAFAHLGRVSQERIKGIQSFFSYQIPHTHTYYYIHNIPTYYVY